MSGDSSTNMTLIYIIVGVGAGLLLIFIVFICFFHRRKKRQQKQKERSYELQMDSLEAKVAKECREGKISWLALFQILRTGNALQKIPSSMFLSGTLISSQWES